MLLRLKTSELGGGGGAESARPEVQRVFKSPGKVGLRIGMREHFPPNMVVTSSENSLSEYQEFSDIPATEKGKGLQFFLIFSFVVIMNAAIQNSHQLLLKRTRKLVRHDKMLMVLWEMNQRQAHRKTELIIKILIQTLRQIRMQTLTQTVMYRQILMPQLTRILLPSQLA